MQNFIIEPFGHHPPPLILPPTDSPEDVQDDPCQRKCQCEERMPSATGSFLPPSTSSNTPGEKHEHE